MDEWDGEDYQRRFDRLAESGRDVHGEADLVAQLQPRSVLDAGCGTGRVAIELAARGIDVVAVDPDASMLATAARRGPELRWVHSTMQELQLEDRFDVVVMAGNVPLFCGDGNQAALVAGCARHLRGDGHLVAGFQLGRGYDVERYDHDCTACDLVLVDRWSTWDRATFRPGTSDYAVSVHRLVSPT